MSGLIFYLYSRVALGGSPPHKHVKTNRDTNCLLKDPSTKQDKAILSFLYERLRNFQNDQAVQVGTSLCSDRQLDVY